MPRSSPQHRQELGQRIRDARGKMTAKELAGKVGISPSYLSEVERGESDISSEKLHRIARHLGLSLDYLLEGGDPHGEANAREINIPAGLSEAADKLDLTFNQTIRLLQARQSLRAARGEKNELDCNGWIRFYKRVKDFMEG